MVKEHESTSQTSAALQGCRLKPWLTLLAFSLSTVTVLAKDSQMPASALPNMLGAAPAVSWSQIPPVVMAVFEDDLLGPFTQLRVGMTAAEVLAAMKHKPQRQETSTHLGLEIQRLVWTHWTSGSTYQVVLVAGRLVSKSNEIKPLIG